MLIQKIDILCNIILRVPEERVRFIVDHIDTADPHNGFYGEFKRYKYDKQGHKRKNKPDYVAINGGEYWSRTINPPKDELKTIQKRINAYLVDNIDMPSYAFGGIKGKDNILNARMHKGQKYIFQTDLKDFFPHITHKVVMRYLSGTVFLLTSHRCLQNLQHTKAICLKVLQRLRLSRTLCLSLLV